MFAVLKTGGKQYKVSSGDVLRIEKLAADAGDTVQFNDVLMVGDQIGSPFVAGAAVQATVIDQIKGEKTIHFVRRRRKHSSKRTKGHRQQLTLVRVTDILASGGGGTGVKAAIGAGFREPQFDAPRGVVAGALSSVAAPVAEALAPVAEALTPVAEALAPVAAAAKRAVKRVPPVADVTAPVVEKVTSVAKEARPDATPDTTPDAAASTGGISAAVTGALGAILGAAATTAVDAIMHPRDSQSETDAPSDDDATKE